MAFSDPEADGPTPGPARPRLVTVVIPAFNAEPHLGSAIESVLAQTWPALDVIVIDDGSTDGTRAIAVGYARRDPRVRVLAQRNAGPSAARNAGLEAASGDAVCFLDADDVYLPDKIQRQAAMLALHPECDLVYSDFYEGDEHASPLTLRSVAPGELPMRELLAYRTPFATFSVLLRRSLVVATGAFDPAIHACEDRDYWIRAERRGRFCYLAGPVAVYRSHAGQSHRDLRKVRVGQRLMIAKNFAVDSVEWRTAQACLAYSDARVAWGRRQVAPVVIGLLRSAGYARSPRRLRRVVRYAGYG